MAWRLVRLKLTLMAGAWRRGVGHGLLQLLGLFAAAGIGAAGVLLAVLAGALAAELRVLLATSAVLVWTVGPVLGVGLDETLDPARLRLLPLPRRTLVSGLALASAVGPGGVATLLPLMAFGLSAARSTGQIVVGVVAALAQLLICVLVARLVATSVARIMRTRRGRDAVTLVSAGSGLLFAGLGQVPRLLVDADPERARETIAMLTGFVRWLPTSWSMTAVNAAGEGRWAQSLALLAGTGIVVVLLGRWWSQALATALERADDHVSRRARRVGLIQGVAAWLPASPVGAAAARELRYAVRAPQRRIGTVMIVLAGVAPVIALLLAPGLRDPRAVLLGAAPAALAVLTSLNLFAADGPAIWHALVVPGGGTAELRGKNLGLAATCMPVVALSALVTAALSSGWSQLLPTVMIGAAVLLVGSGSGQVVSVLVPLPQSDSPTNAFATGSGVGCVQGIAFTAAMTVSGVVALPVVIAVALSLAVAPAWYWPAVVASVAYATVLWLLGHRLATRILEGGPERFLARVEAASS
jgi:ABC-2 type transport system permease protein